VDCSQFIPGGVKDSCSLNFVGGNKVAGFLDIPSQFSLNFPAPRRLNSGEGCLVPGLGRNFAASWSARALLILPAQCRATRALVEMDQAELARRAVVPRHVVADFENGAVTPSANNLAAIRTALEASGVILIGENGEGSGVRLRKTSRRGPRLNQ
jgi:hypothetical protein